MREGDVNERGPQYSERRTCTTQGLEPHDSQSAARHPPTLPDEGHDSYLRKPERDPLSAEEGAGESKQTRLDCREGDPDSRRRRREGDVLDGEHEGLKRRRRAPEPREATSTIACWERREDEVCPPPTERYRTLQKESRSTQAERTTSPAC